MNIFELERELSVDKIDKESDNIITINEKKINLTRLGIDFNLNDQQIDALEKIAKFLEKDNPELSFTLSGYAGTGKTVISKIILKYINLKFGYNYSLEVTAPTNRAKNVIESLSGKKAKTIHSVLGLLPNLDIEKLDLRTLKFDNRKEAQMPHNLLIIDEASMCNDFLVTIIHEKASAKGCKILFIGDEAQLKPVKQNDVSSVFKVTNTAQLTKVERQKNGNPIGPILDDIRNNPFSDTLVFDFITTLNDKGEGVEFINTSSEFLENALDSIKNVVLYTDYLHSRIVTYTNKRTELYNKLIRSKLGFDGEYHKGELLMAYDNVGNNEYQGIVGLVNSCDYIIENDVKPEERYILDHKLIGYPVNLVSTDERNRLNQFILSKDNDKEVLGNLAFAIEDVRLGAIYEKDRHKKSNLWNEYYRNIGSFISPFPLTVDGRHVKGKSIDFGYSITCHRAQGGTFQKVFVDYRDFSICKDTQTKNQLLYVGLSRCSQKAVMFY